jgi:hypothetical protein
VRFGSDRGVRLERRDRREDLALRLLADGRGHKFGGHLSVAISDFTFDDRSVPLINSQLAAIEF